MDQIWLFLCVSLPYRIPSLFRSTRLLITTQSQPIANPRFDMRDWENTMSTWRWLDVAGVVRTGLLVIALGWSARERARIHREWARLQSERDEKGVQVIDWCVALGALAGYA